MASTSTLHAALEGVRVLDFSRMLPGPWGTQMLADLGADVIKVEQPGVGDLGRHNSPNFRDGSVYFNTVNLNKRSVALDLADTDDRALAHALMEQADVVVESFRGGVATRLGIGYDVAQRLNPGVVYCSITGFGQHGPFADIPGHDLVIQAVTGVMGVNAVDGTAPPIPGFQTGDFVAASYAVIAVLAALNRRTATGEGGHIDVSMYDALFSMGNIFNGLALARASGNTSTRGMELWGGNPRYSTYTTKDGRAVAVSLLEARIWAHFCRLIGRPDLVDENEGPEDRHTAHGGRSELYRRALSDFCASRTRDELVAEMVAHDVPILPVYSPEEAIASEQAKARGLVEWIDHPQEGRIPVLANPLASGGLTTGIRRPAPGLGEHTQQVRRHGWSGARTET